MTPKHYVWEKIIKKGKPTTEYKSKKEQILNTCKLMKKRKQNQSEV